MTLWVGILSIGVLVMLRSNLRWDRRYGSYRWNLGDLISILHMRRGVVANGRVAVLLHHGLGRRWCLLGDLNCGNGPPMLLRRDARWGTGSCGRIVSRILSKVRVGSRRMGHRWWVARSGLSRVMVSGTRLLVLRLAVLQVGSLTMRRSGCIEGRVRGRRA